MWFSPKPSDEMVSFIIVKCLFGKRQLAAELFLECSLGFSQDNYLDIHFISRGCLVLLGHLGLVVK